MSIKYVDFLSPTITLYFNGSHKHSSVFSGIVTIIHYLLVLSVCIYYFCLFILKSNPTFFYFREYIEDAGTFYLDTSQIFHYITLDRQPFDPRAMSVIGVHKAPDDILENNSEDQLDYWRYSKCDFNLHVPQDLLPKIHTDDCLCISEFHNHTTQKTIKVGDPEFKYPTLEHGIGSKDVVYYGIVFQGCQNITTGGTCYSKEKNQAMMTKVSAFNVFIADHYISIENYTHPAEKFFQKTESGIYPNNILVNNLHFSPTEIKTHTGILFESEKKFRTYSFDQAVKGSYLVNNSTIGTMSYFWMHNQMDFYERYYLKLPEILANISGIEKFSYMILFTINLVYNRFVILSDFNSLLSSTMGNVKLGKKRTLVSIQTVKIPAVKISKFNKTLPSEQQKMGTLKPRKKVLLSQTISHYFKFKHNPYIISLVGFRKKLISEEKMLQIDCKIEKYLSEFFGDKEDGSIYNSSIIGTQLKTGTKDINLKDNITNSNVDLINKM